MLTAGTISTFPTEIEPGKTNPEIRVTAADANAGSASNLTYNYVYGGRDVSLTFEFSCRSAGASAKVTSNDPSVIAVSVSPYSVSDHPLKVTYEVGNIQLH
ncbi:hypothetical protein AJ80_03569 [Polytolypa hystricis UAMH7299]|uniref:Uncharacterized protein n=1 Tax=Polytolypa hystricis (strain UAMH7299) TaxID=1447883 RepID=A0A2B7Y8M8_POLH7|nr:hypothetical protein AJ80_03569 [Polytolypa hystricis UAMH7299]